MPSLLQIQLLPIATDERLGEWVPHPLLVTPPGVGPGSEGKDVLDVVVPLIAKDAFQSSR